MPVFKCSLQLSTPSGIDISKLISAAETVYVSQTVTYATGTSNSSLAFGGVTTCDILYLESDKQVTLKQVSGDTAITVDANGFVLLMGTSATAWLISNSSGATATIKYIIAGA